MFVDGLDMGIKENGGIENDSSASAQAGAG